MTREEAIKRIKDWNLDDGTMEVLSAAIPELRESEDERIRKSLINYVYCHGDAGDFTKKEFITWLEKQKERKPQSKQEWSEEDEDYYDAIITKLEVTQEDASLTDNQMDFLKSLKEKMQPQPKQEWSKEDEVMLGNALWACKEKYSSTETYNWLKSIKDRMVPTNKNDFDRGYEVGISAAKFNQWKPTEEQMLYLASAIGHFDFCDPEHAALEAIYTHFKKL